MTNDHQILINDIEEEIAIEASSLYFQNEMLKEEEEIDMIKLYKQIGDFIDESIDMISWSYLYPVIKECVKNG